VRGRPWTHYAAPAAFLLAATIAVLLVRSALSHQVAATTTTIPLAPRKTVVTTTTPKPPAKVRATARVYIVQSGDTFEVISSKTGVPVARIQQLNPKVQSTALYIGQKLRIR
jgi:LysM repeat protein